MEMTDVRGGLLVQTPSREVLKVSTVYPADRLRHRLRDRSGAVPDAAADRRPLVPA